MLWGREAKKKQKAHHVLKLPQPPGLLLIRCNMARGHRVEKGPGPMSQQKEDHPIRRNPSLLLCQVCNLGQSLLHLKIGPSDSFLLKVQGTVFSSVENQCIAVSQEMLAQRPIPNNLRLHMSSQPSSFKGLITNGDCNLKFQRDLREDGSITARFDLDFNVHPILKSDPTKRSKGPQRTV